MASTDRDYEISMLRKQLARDRAQGLRSVWSRGRALEASIVASQLRVVSTTDMRNEDGAFYFVVGYSTVGGPDVIRP